MAAKKRPDDDGDKARRALFEKLCVYVLGAVQDLRDLGLVEGDVGARLMPGAIGQYDQLKASGFRPTANEIDMVMAAFARAAGTIPPPLVVGLVKKHARNEIPGLGQ